MIKAKIIIILLNCGEKVVVIPKNKEPSDDPYKWLCEEWEKAYVTDGFIHPIDKNGLKHKVNARRVIDIYEGELTAAEKVEEEEELNIDQE